MLRLLVLSLISTMGVSGADHPVITEFLAINESGAADSDGECSPWIEIFNPHTSQSIELGLLLFNQRPERTEEMAVAEDQSQSRLTHYGIRLGKGPASGFLRLAHQLHVDRERRFLGPCEP